MGGFLYRGHLRGLLCDNCHILTKDGLILLPVTMYIVYCWQICSTGV